MTYEKFGARSIAEMGILVSDQITAMIAYWDKDLICRFANHAYLDWFGKSKAEMINKITIQELLGPLYEKNLPYIELALAGHKQIFEREIPSPKGDGVRHSLATYFPDIVNGEVVGFTVHVADITYIKNLELEVQQTRREMLRNFIQTEERERTAMHDILQENVNQKLAYCKMILEMNQAKDVAGAGYLTEINEQLSNIISDISNVSKDLAHNEINILGLVPSLELYLAEQAKKITNSKLSLMCLHRVAIETLGFDDKLAIFRIVESYVKMWASQHLEQLEVHLHFQYPNLELRFLTANTYSVNKKCNDYTEIEFRVAYYGGSISEQETIADSGFCVKMVMP